MGELELLRASDMTTDEAEWDVIVQTGAIWLAWAFVSPCSSRSRSSSRAAPRHWLLAALCHLPLAFGVGSAFLAGEIAVREALQGPEDTGFRRLLETVRVARARLELGRPPRPRRPGRGEWRRRDEDEDREGAIVPRELPPSSGRARARTRARPEGRCHADRRWQRERPDGREARLSADDREIRRPPFTRDQFRRLRKMGRRTTANVATGDFAADFERRWRLRVPRYGLIYLALILIGLGSRAFLVGRQREREALDLELRAERLEAELVEARLTALKGQLHPHFLFNALHSVGGLIRSADPGRALTALAQVGDLLRTSLDAGGQQFVTLGREVELLRRYLDVEALRLGEKLRVEFAIHQGLEECEVPAFITQPSSRTP